MAIYRLSAQILARSKGRSATAAAAYRAGCRIEDAGTGKVHDYSRREGVQHAAILAPANAPAWVQDRAALWNAVEQAERRKDAQLARELQLALPHELQFAERLRLVTAFVDRELVGRGMIADVALHRPDRSGDRRNHHAHILLSLREITPQGFGRKVRAWNDKPLLEALRASWGRFVNSALGRAGISSRVDHRAKNPAPASALPPPARAVPARSPTAAPL